MLTLVDDLGQGLVVDVDAPRERALVDIDDLLDSVLSHHQVAAAHRDVSVRHIRIPPGRPSGTVQGDVTQLERVIDRLVSNALRVTPDSGLILVSVTVDADAVAVEVADEGPGLDAMRISELFAPMQDTHGSAHNPGIALGLSVCRRIAEQHGGSLDVTSEPGNGATFTLVLPAATDALPLAVTPDGPPSPPAATPSLHGRRPAPSPPTTRAPFLTVVHDGDADDRSRG
jgi:two-component system OmpR family sensor kinase